MCRSRLGTRVYVVDCARLMSAGTPDSQPPDEPITRAVLEVMVLPPPALTRDQACPMMRRS